MRTEELEATWRGLLAGLVAPERALVFADALEEAGHPFAPYVRGRQECREEDLPAGVAAWLLGEPRGLTERLVLEEGVLRGVRFLTRETAWVGEEPWLMLEGARAGELVDERVEGVDFEQDTGAIVELLSRPTCRTVVEVSGVTFETFKQLSELDLGLRAASVIQDQSEDLSRQFWWCGTALDPDPAPIRRLRVRELTVDGGPIGPQETVRWLLSSGPEVFDRLESLRAPGAGEVCVEALLRGRSGRLRHLDEGEWSATRDDRGWHLVLGRPADGQRLYEDLQLELALDSWPRLIDALAEVVADVVFRGPRMPLGELPAFEAAARGKPIRFELGHPAEEATRAARGLPARRFDADAPLLDRDLPF